MSDYIPTTEVVVLPPLNEEVIKGLALLGLDQMVGVDDERAKQFEDAFDQWLEEHDRVLKEMVWDSASPSTDVQNPYRKVYGKVKDEHKVQVTDAANPYRQREEQ